MKKKYIRNPNCTRALFRRRLTALFYKHNISILDYTYKFFPRTMCLKFVCLLMPKHRRNISSTTEILNAKETISIQILIAGRECLGQTSNQKQFQWLERHIPNIRFYIVDKWHEIKWTCQLTATFNDYWIHTKYTHFKWFFFLFLFKFKSFNWKRECIQLHELRAISSILRAPIFIHSIFQLLRIIRFVYLVIGFSVNRFPDWKIYDMKKTMPWSK